MAGNDPVPTYATSMWSVEEMDRRLLYATGENLLDNWYFGPGVINQKKFTSANTPGYTVDRWYCDCPHGLSCSLNDNSFHLDNANGFFQLFDTPLASFLHGKTVTLSILLNDNNLFSVTVVFKIDSYVESTINNLIFYRIGMTHKNNQPGIVFWGVYKNSTYPNGIEVSAAKLELGPVQTLAHKEGDTWVLNDPPPNYTLELLKCQRYQVAFMHNICRMSTYNNNQISFIVNLPVNMISIPTIAIGSLGVKHIIDGSVVSGFSFNVSKHINNIVQITATKTGHGMQDGILYASTLTLLDANL